MRYTFSLLTCLVLLACLAVGCSSAPASQNETQTEAPQTPGQAGRVLMIVTSHGKLGPWFAASAEPTGLWYEELAGPYYAFQKAGYKVDIVSIQGGRPPIDPRSVRDRGMTEDVMRFILDPQAQSKLQNAPAIASADPANYYAIYLSGGHGTMWDFPRSDELQNLLKSAIENNQVVGLVCHAPAALVGLQGSDRQPIIKGRKVNGFTNEEEQQVGLTDQVPFLLEDQLKAQGGRFIQGPAFEPFFVVDKNLFTGQNPASSKPMAKEMIRVLQDSQE